LGLLFFYEKSFVWVEIVFFRLKFGENLPVKTWGDTKHHPPINQKQGINL
jgi:hypothetical protein